MKKLVIVISTVLVVGLLGAGGAWAYFHYAKSPEIQIMESLMKLSDTKSISYDASISMSGDTNPKQIFDNLLEQKEETITETKHNEISLRFSGESDMTNSSSPASHFKFALDIKQDNIAQGRTVNLELINKDKIFYFLMPQLPEAESAKDYSEFSNKWIEFDYSKLSSELDMFKEQLLKKVSTTLPSTEEDEQVLSALKRIALTNPPLTVVEKFADEKINGTNVHHYAYVPNEQNIEILMNEMVKNEKVTGVHQSDIEKIRKFFAELKEFRGEIWIDAKTLYPNKLTLVIAGNDNDHLKNGRVEISVQFKNFNVPLNIQKPSETISFEELIAKFFEVKLQREMEKIQLQDEMFASSTFQFDFGSQPIDWGTSSIQIPPPAGGSSSFGIQRLNTQPKSPEIDTDGDGLSDSEEQLVWKTDIKNKDTDGDGYSDKTEVDGGYDPLRKFKKLLEP